MFLAEQVAWLVSVSGRSYFAIRTHSNAVHWPVSRRALAVRRSILRLRNGAENEITSNAPTVRYLFHSFVREINITRIELLALMAFDRSGKLQCASQKKWVRLSPRIPGKLLHPPCPAAIATIGTANTPGHPAKPLPPSENPCRSGGSIDIEVLDISRLELASGRCARGAVLYRT